MPETTFPLSEDIQQLIKQGHRFTQDDVEKLERLAPILGRCHEMVYKIEHFFSFSNNYDNMTNVYNEMNKYIDSSKSNFSEIQKHMRRF